MKSMGDHVAAHEQSNKKLKRQIWAVVLFFDWWHTTSDYDCVRTHLFSIKNLCTQSNGRLSFSHCVCGFLSLSLSKEILVTEVGGYKRWGWSLKDSNFEWFNLDFILHELFDGWSFGFLWLVTVLGIGNSGDGALLREWRRIGVSIKVVDAVGLRVVIWGDTERRDVFEGIFLRSDFWCTRGLVIISSMGSVVWGWRSVIESEVSHEFVGVRSFEVVKDHFFFPFEKKVRLSLFWVS